MGKENFPYKKVESHFSDGHSFFFRFGILPSQNFRRILNEIFSRFHEETPKGDSLGDVCFVVCFCSVDRLSPFLVCSFDSHLCDLPIDKFA